MAAEFEPPTIEFPCEYPIKVIAEQEDTVVREVLQVVRQHAPEVTPDQVTTRPSRAGNFLSVRVTIQATGEEQLKAMHADLMNLSSVRLVL